MKKILAFTLFFSVLFDQTTHATTTVFAADVPTQESIPSFSPNDSSPSPQQVLSDARKENKRLLLIKQKQGIGVYSIDSDPSQRAWLPKLPTKILRPKTYGRLKKSALPAWMRNKQFVSLSSSVSKRWSLIKHTGKNKKTAFLLYDSKNQITYEIQSNGMSAIQLLSPQKVLAAPFFSEDVCLYNKTPKWQWLDRKDVLILQSCDTENAMITVMYLENSTVAQISGTTFWIY